MRLTKAFSLFELILVIFISSITLILTLKFIKEINLTQIENQNLAILKTDMLSTKIIIEKNLPQIINTLNYSNKTLYFGNAVLLDNVTKFNMQNGTNILNIHIELDNKISQNWSFKL
ncbi:hypothetical protein [Halarcobacter ebronensis]|uniref:Prepilin-type cleavage/methylation domain-containing protein n=1 Tax=Halarcobacter ebronensis TaxID=1462615 RepID=A0A4Q1AJZ0_9BACT|nr:hypothetical protein [Halarcobacter ebronensis]QKF81260.1 hypothetical protein AEBR_0760 [Halarcobacter ebronensis]RXK04826.1 hypothetical protein CRV07_09560 [Halarcobacter ebronensis]